MIYFIESNKKFVKIGTTVDVAERVKALQTSNPMGLKVKAVLPGTYQTEAGLHQLFEHIRYNGEWFRLTDEMKWYMRAIQENPQETNIYTLYRKSQQMRLKCKAKRLGSDHKLSKRINKHCGA